MTIGELLGLGSGIVIPLGILIVGGFWKLNNEIRDVKACFGKQQRQIDDDEKSCTERHTNIERRLERIDNWKEGK